MVLVVVTILFGQEIKGARRWIFGIQPSEFVKPRLCRARCMGVFGRSKAPAVRARRSPSCCCRSPSCPSMLQPDFGQTMLIRLVWAALFFMAGLHRFWVIGHRRVCGASGAMLAFKLVPHVRGPDPPLHRSRRPAAALPTLSSGYRARKFHRRRRGSAKGRAKERSSASCPTATPISFSR